MPYMTAARRTSKDHCFCASLASRSGPWPASSAVIRCPGIAWSAGWAGSALWEPPSARRRCPSTYWPTASSRARRPEGLHRHDRRQRVLPGSDRPRRQGATSEGRLPSLQRRGLRCLPQTRSHRQHRWLEGDASGLEVLSTKVVILLCFLHGSLKIHDRAKHLKEVFPEVSRRDWDTYRAALPPEFRTTPALAPASRRPDTSGIVLEKVLDLCGERDRWSIAYRHPGGHRHERHARPI